MKLRVLIGILLSPFLIAIAFGLIAGYIIIWLVDIGDYVLKGKLGNLHEYYWSMFKF